MREHPGTGCINGLVTGHDFRGCGKSLQVVTFSPQRIAVDKRDAWRRSEADGDVQLCDVIAADTGLSPGASDPGDGGSGAGWDGRRVRRAVFAYRPSVDRSGASASGHSVDGVVLDSQRAAVDGAFELQPSVSMVCGS